MSEADDYQRALLDPESVFAQPEDVLTSDSLTREQKIEVLRRWSYDASEVAVAEEEGMKDGPPMVHRVIRALDRLTGGVDVEHSAPTKQKGF
mgnify:FL=1|jgi:hypothetical protein